MRYGVRRALVTLTAASFAAGWPARALVQSAGPAGTWIGSYTCAQGVTALDLSLTADGGNRVRGIFHFASLPPRHQVPEGCFRMAGRFDPQTGALTLAPGEWLRRPPGYVTVGLRGVVTPDGGTLAGRVEGPGCTSFTLRRAAAPLPRPPSCAASAPAVALAAH